MNRDSFFFSKLVHEEYVVYADGLDNVCSSNSKKDVNLLSSSFFYFLFLLSEGITILIVYVEKTNSCSYKQTLSLFLVL